MAGEVKLRAVRDSDLDAFFAHQRDPAAIRMVAFCSRDPEDRALFDAHWVKIRRDPAIVMRTIEVEGRPAGYVGGFERDGKTEVCYYLGRSFWGRGIASTALARFLVEVPTRPLFAFIAGDNAGSIRVVEKCGFALVARQRSFAQARGEEIEEVVLRLG